MAAAKISLKILIEKKSQRVLFAEADKKFVDFLFSILTLPVGTVTRLLQKHNMAGSLHSLYKSIENLSDDIYLQPEQDKDFLLNPMVAIYGAKVPLLLPSVEKHSYSAKKFYTCAGNWYDVSLLLPVNCHSVANDRRAVCPSCRKSITNELRYIDYVDPVSKDIKASSSSEGGYVKGVITYMVMDDLDVKPMSIISAIILLTKFNVTDVGAVEEKVVELGMDEGVKLLGASLQSRTVLSDVFLRKDRNHTVKEEFGIEHVE